MNEANALENEETIVWLRDVNEMAYVREIFLNASRRKGRMKYGNHEIVGYAELRQDARNNGLNGVFTRRVFWIAKHDRIYAPEGTYKIGCPVEGVDPLTVAPGLAGKQSTRAWGETN